MDFASTFLKSWVRVLSLGKSCMYDIFIFVDYSSCFNYVQSTTRRSKMFQ